MSGRPTTAEISAFFAHYLRGATVARELAAPKRWRGRFIRLTQLVATVPCPQLSVFVYDLDKGLT